MSDEVGKEVWRDRDQPVAAPDTTDVTATAQPRAESDHPVKGQPREDCVRELVLERDDEAGERAPPQRGRIALHPDQPSARRVYQPAVLP